MTATIIHGDCLEAMRGMEDNSVDAVICDPPYGLSNTSPDKVTETIVRWAQGDREYVPKTSGGFMGAAWDSFVPPPAVWDECYRVLKPGGHVAVFAGTRTMDIMTLGVRLAGFDIRDSLAWLYGSGFPKSQDVSKQIDKRPGVGCHKAFAEELAKKREATGLSRSDVSESVVGTRSGACWNWEHHQFPRAQWWPALRDLLGMNEAKWGPVIAEVERQVVGTRTTGIGTGKGGTAIMGDSANRDITAPATPAAKQWSGWGTALKPAFEPIILARKPFPGTVASNVLSWGTGAINIDATRIRSNKWDDEATPCDSCAKPAEKTPKPGAQATRESIAVTLADSTEPAPRLKSPTDTRTTTDTGCSDGTTVTADESSNSSTDTYGSSTTGAKSPTGTSPTTSTSAKLTTGSKTCNSCHAASTQHTTTKASETPARDSIAGTGRWPSNVVLDTVTAGLLDQQSGTSKSKRADRGVDAGVFRLDGFSTVEELRAAAERGEKTPYGRDAATTYQRHLGRLDNNNTRGHDDEGGASRFFHVVENLDRLDAPFKYCAKAPKKERPTYEDEDGNTVQHATVKPVSLMRWLVKLLTPPGGTVLDPFAGSGTTVEAAILEGFHPIGIEAHGPYIRLIQQRVTRATDNTTQDPQPDLFEGAA